MLVKKTIDGKEWWQWSEDGELHAGREGMYKALADGVNDEMHSIKDVPIFAVGKHNGEEFTAKDLDDIAAAFKELDFAPALKQGHRKEQPGDPALGYVDNVRRVGSRLVADFVNMPTVVYNAIKRKSYNRVSSEIWVNLERGGKKFRLALKAVSLLGAEVPGVWGLAPLSSLLKHSGEADVKAYEFNFNEDSDMSKTVEEMQKELEAQQAAAEKTAADLKKFQDESNANKARAESLEKQVKELAAKDRTRSIAERVTKCSIPAFREALTHVYELAMTETVSERVFSIGDKKVAAVEVVDSLINEINAKAAKLFSEDATVDVKRKEGDELDNPGEEVDRRAKEFMAKNNETSYSAALRSVLISDKELAARYNAVN